MNFEMERLRQMGQQAQAIEQRAKQPLNQIATYQGLDLETGNRLLALSDGSIFQQSWITNSSPDTIPAVSIASSVPGMPGFSSQRPAG
jgi:hypothetical protein